MTNDNFEYREKQYRRPPIERDSMQELNVNRVLIAGRLVKNPPLRRTKKGIPVTNFVIETLPDSRKLQVENFGGRPCFVSVVAWAQQATLCKRLLSRGNSVLICGELQSMPNADIENGFLPVQINVHSLQILSREAEPDDTGEVQETATEVIDAKGGELVDTGNEAGASEPQAAPE
jgi:single-stranded DNA-binding protein